MNKKTLHRKDRNNKSNYQTILRKLSKNPKNKEVNANVRWLE